MTFQNNECNNFTDISEGFASLFKDSYSEYFDEVPLPELSLSANNSTSLSLDELSSNGVALLLLLYWANGIGSKTFKF